MEDERTTTARKNEQQRTEELFLAMCRALFGVKLGHAGAGKSRPVSRNSDRAQRRDAGTLARFSVLIWSGRTWMSGVPDELRRLTRPSLHLYSDSALGLSGNKSTPSIA
jgi:hypothetical protein